LRQLLLMRHAKSSWDDPAMADHARPLNARGRASAVAMRDAIRQLGLVPDVVLVSPAVRTMQTLDALGPWDETPLIDPIEALYLADLKTLFATLQGVAETVRSVLLVGHNPGLHELAIALMGESAPSDQMSRRVFEGYPTGALAEFSVPGPWGSLAEGGGRLLRFLAPRDLPETV